MMQTGRIGVNLAIEAKEFSEELMLCCPTGMRQGP